jgi:hypothetical protein
MQPAEINGLQNPSIHAIVKELLALVFSERSGYGEDRETSINLVGKPQDVRCVIETLRFFDVPKFLCCLKTIEDRHPEITSDIFKGEKRKPYWISMSTISKDLSDVNVSKPS